ncbi:GTP-binding protein [Bacillus sp. FJAT-49711]|uniref:CobW family GTP-binding protein n=1 Tax=Bacillus sp. FJAT-49711 TaxID=2833585 RepID=UPI001BC8F5AC|nr:GTP-binding protein [Bacillus sp. FJAT-49711]MBS4220254.1 GTP-binding protein [Bacillus sp. FJAT-49711]
MKSEKRIPVYVLSGFLGSGKTTVLLSMLEYSKKKGWQPGVILNELGEANVENHLFENEKVFELLNGCICCTIQDDLKSTLDELVLEMEKQPLDILFIEGTGVANPLEIQEVLLSSPYIEQFELMSVITVLDASHYLEYQSIFSSSAEVRNLMKEQTVCGSLLLLNKTDLIPEGQLEKIKQKITKIVGKEKVMIESLYGKINPEHLFEKRIESILVGNGISEKEHHHHHHSTVQAIKLEDVPVIRKKTFEKWLKQLPVNILRGKGFIEMEGSKQIYSFQFASNKVAFAPIPSSLNRKPMIILIGMGLEEDQIHKHWKQLFV